MNDAETYAYLQGLSEETFVLHGSPYAFDVAEPRPAECGSGTEYKNRCAVYASITMFDPVIRAVIHGDTGWRHANSQIKIEGEDLRLGEGYIYVLPRAAFEELDNRFWFAAYEPVHPVEMIKIRPTILTLFPEIVLPCNLRLVP